MQAVAVMGDPRTNSVIVAGSEDTMIKVAQTVNEIDRTDAKKQHVYIVPLKQGTDLEQILREQLRQPGHVDPELRSQPHQGDPGPPDGVLRRNIGSSLGDPACGRKGRGAG